MYKLLPTQFSDLLSTPVKDMNQHRWDYVRLSVLLTVSVSCEESQACRERLYG